MNNSFYGGRDGQPMIIKAKFLTVKEMTTAFKDPNYITVNFGEYALIETTNRKNPENGFLFRRGYDYQDEFRYVECWDFNENTGNFNKNSTLAYGAIYVGKIAGPAGDAPLVEFKNATVVANEREVLLNKNQLYVDELAFLRQFHPLKSPFYAILMLDKPYFYDFES